jgi:branched-chain amino acid transport system substrate-binding protein
MIRCLVLALALAMVTSLPVKAVDPYELNVILEQTGFFAFFGSKQAEALKAIENLVNTTGGIQGRQLKFVIHDDTTNPQVAVQIANRLIAAKVPVILGPGLTATCGALYPLVQQNGPMLFCYSPGLQPPLKGYAFRAGPAIDDAMPVVTRYFYRRGMKNIGYMSTTDASGQSWDQSMDVTLNRLEFKDVRVVAREHWAINDMSTSAQVARIKAARPQVIYAMSSGTAFGTALRAIYESGLDVPVFTTGANMNIPQLKSYAGFMPKELYFYGTEGLVVDPGAQPAVRQQQTELAKAMKQAGLRLELPHQQTWDPTMIVIEAVRKVGPNATAEQLHAYMQNLRNRAGAAGYYNFYTGDQTGIHENGCALYRYSTAKEDWELVATGPRFI